MILSHEVPDLSQFTVRQLNQLILINNPAKPTKSVSIQNDTNKIRYLGYVLAYYIFSIGKRKKRLIYRSVRFLINVNKIKGLWHKNR
jgi:hypothetical protein